MKLFTSCTGNALPLKLKILGYSIIKRPPYGSGFRNKTYYKIRTLPEQPSTAVRVPFEDFSTLVRHCSQTASTLLRELFDKSSTALRRFFDKEAEDCRRPVEEQWENTRTSVGAGTYQVECKYGGLWERSRRMVGENPSNPIKNIRKPALKLLALCFPLSTFLFCVCLAHAGQREISPAATGVTLSTDTIKPLKIGDTIPEVLWNLPLQIVQAGQEGTTTIHLEGDKTKLIILDFWATWCSPCLASLAKLDTLQTRFVNQLAILPITYETPVKALSCFQQHHWKLPTIINQTTLKKYFPFRTMPHQVWIMNGKVYAINYEFDTTEANISATLQDQRVDMIAKEDAMALDKAAPIFKSSNKLPDSLFLYHSVFTHYIDGLGSSNMVYSNKTSYYNFDAVSFLVKAHLNWPLWFIGQKNQVLFDVPDSIQHRMLLPENLQNKERYKWQVQHTFCYELAFRKPISRKIQSDIMKQDVDRFFGAYLGITTEVVVKRFRCLALYKMPGNKEAERWDTEELLKRLIKLDNGTTLFFNRTGHSGKDTLPQNVQATSVKEFNEKLLPYGFFIAQTSESHPLLIISTLNQSK